MSRDLVTRRSLLKALSCVAVAAPLLQACGGAGSSAPAATAAAAAAAAQSAAKVSATQVSAAPTQAPAAAATQAPASAATTAPATGAQATPAPATGTKTNLSIAVWTIAGREWQKQYAQKYQQAHPEINLKIDEIVYDDMAKKQLAEIATGTLQDAVYSGIKWMSYSAYKGAFRAIDDYVSQKDPGMDDYYPSGLAGTKFEGKMYALPFEVNPGNLNVIVYNKDMLAKKGMAEPKDTWTYDQYTDFATKMTDKAAKIYGTDIFFGSYYDFGTIARSYGGDDLSADSKQFTFSTDAASMKAAQWAYDIRVKYQAAPSRAESQGIQFPAGQLASTAQGVQSVVSLGKTIGDKFKWGVVLGPTGPDGLRGQDGFVTMYNIDAKSKQPEAAYELIMFMTSKDTATYAMSQQGQPSARKSVWTSPEVGQVSDIFAKAEKWMGDPKNKGPFPMPNNLRFSELQDKWANTTDALWYGELGFDEGVKKVQDSCNAIVTLPRN